MKDVQCYELFRGIAHKNHVFYFFSFSLLDWYMCSTLDNLSTTSSAILLRLETLTSDSFSFDSIN